MAKIPESIGKYKVETLIAKGGMGAVYKAMHPTLHRPVIIKKLTLRGRKDITERFKREAMILMDIRHDGVVDMYDHFKLGSSYYIVLEFLDGASLDDVIKRERYLDNGTAAYILYYAARALHYAHEKKVVHRDIKPANLLLSRKGEIKLVDFGIAASDKDSEEGLTRDGMTLGTPSYMAPEQFRNTKNVDLRADIYSLGVLAYEMLTGKKPFPGGFSSELLSDIQKGKYPSPRKYNPRIHPVLLRFINKSMKPKPERRYKDLSQAIPELDRFLRSFDKAQLSGIVADLAVGKEPVKPTYRKKGNILLKIVLPVAAALVLSLFCAFSYFTGYYNELFRGDNYGAAVFLIRTPAEHRPWHKVFINTEIFQDDNDVIPALPGKKVIFLKIREEGKEDSYLFQSLPVYLPRGPYRAKVQIEDDLNWHSFIILSENKHQLNPFTVADKVVISEHRRIIPVSLSVNIESSDIVTGITVDGGIELTVYHDKEWVELTEAEDLKTGSIYKFRIRHEAYFTKIFSLKIRGDQDLLKIHAGLVPLPGTLTLTREHEGMEFLLDGTDHLLSADAVPIQLDLNGDSEFRGNIAPGSYELEMRYRGKKKTLPIKIVRDETVSILGAVELETGEPDLFVE